MTRQRMIHVLQRLGFDPPEGATDEQLHALIAEVPVQSWAKDQERRLSVCASASAMPPTDAAPTARLSALEAENDTARVTRIATAIDQCIRERRIPAAQRATWIAHALAEETVLGLLQGLPENAANA